MLKNQHSDNLGYPAADGLKLSKIYRNECVDYKLKFSKSMDISKISCRVSCTISCRVNMTNS